MFFRERTTDWAEPRMPVGLAVALLVTVLGVFYFGIFSDGIIQKFTSSTAVETHASIK